MDRPDSLAHPVPGVVQAAELHSATRSMQKKESEVLSTKQEKPRVLSPPSAGFHTAHGLWSASQTWVLTQPLTKCVTLGK